MQDRTSENLPASAIYLLLIHHFAHFVVINSKSPKNHEKFMSL